MCVYKHIKRCRCCVFLHGNPTPPRLNMLIFFSSSSHISHDVLPSIPSHRRNTNTHSIQTTHPPMFFLAALRALPYHGPPTQRDIPTYTSIHARMSPLAHLDTCCDLPAQDGIGCRIAFFPVHCSRGVRCYRFGWRRVVCGTSWGGSIALHGMDVREGVW